MAQAHLQLVDPCLMELLECGGMDKRTLWLAFGIEQINVFRIPTRNGYYIPCLRHTDDLRRVSNNLPSDEFWLRVSQVLNSVDSDRIIFHGNANAVATYVDQSCADVLQRLNEAWMVDWSLVMPVLEVRLGWLWLASRMLSLMMRVFAAMAFLLPGTFYH
jgi:hypothetical protein